MFDFQFVRNAYICAAAAGQGSACESRPPRRPSRLQHHISSSNTILFVVKLLFIAINFSIFYYNLAVPAKSPTFLLNSLILRVSRAF